MKTLLYLVPHEPIDSTESASLRRGRVTRDFLAVRPLDACFHGSFAGADELAALLAKPHGVAPKVHDCLAEPADDENATDVARRVTDGLEALLNAHGGQAMLVLAPPSVVRAYLAGLLGLTASRAKQMVLDECGISLVTREGAGKSTVATVNAIFHLQGTAA
jgi:broad specificity phosphatase PhoE